MDSRPPSAPVDEEENLEGARSVLHWSQWFFPFANEGGATTRHTVTFEWLRDRRPGAGVDRVLLRRVRAFLPCVVAK